MKNFTLNHQAARALRIAHRAQRDKRIAYRINAVLLLGTGWSLKDVHEALLLDESTLRRYVSIYETSGTLGLIKDNHHSREGLLGPVCEEDLRSHLKEVTYTSSKDVIDYVSRTYGVSYSVSGMTKLLKRLGFSYKKPKRSQPSVDVLATMKYLQEYEEKRRSGDPFYFMDGVHAQHNVYLDYGWIYKGDIKYIESNTGRKRININGAINADTHELIIESVKTISSDETLSLLKKIESRHEGSTKVYVVCDNAGYYRSKKVSEYLKGSIIELVFLPAYSPHLNIIERVWGYFKKQVLSNKYYPRFKDFSAACLSFFDQDHRQKFSKLLVEDFHFCDEKSSRFIAACV